jgi:hypothetical protein
LEAAKNGKMPLRHNPGESISKELNNSNLDAMETAEKFIIKE